MMSRRARLAVAALLAFGSVAWAVLHAGQAAREHWEQSQNLRAARSWAEDIVPRLGPGAVEGTGSAKWDLPDEAGHLNIGGHTGPWCDGLRRWGQVWVGGWVENADDLAAALRRIEELAPPTPVFVQVECVETLGRIEMCLDGNPATVEPVKPPAPPSDGEQGATGG